MDWNRNHFLLAGIILFALGVQFRMVETYVLNEPTTKFVNERIKAEPEPQPSTGLFMTAATPSSETLQPPNWLGWVCLSVGGVFILHSMVMKAP